MSTTTKIDRVIANLILKKGKFVQEMEGKLEKFYVPIGDTEVMMLTEPENAKKYSQFAQVVAEAIYDNRRRNIEIIY